MASNNYNFTNYSDGVFNSSNAYKVEKVDNLKSPYNTGNRGKSFIGTPDDFSSGVYPGYERTEVTLDDFNKQVLYVNGSSSHTSSSGSNHGGGGRSFASNTKIINTSSSGDKYSLLSNLTRVEIPFIKVQIGEYVFGVYDKAPSSEDAGREASKIHNIKYPNYIKSLQIVKINGQVNKYSLDLFYQIAPESDPNFFEKVFSSVSKSRKIVFSYGDLSMPTFIYRDEEGIITNVTSSFDCKNACIKYTVSAISSASLLQAVTIPYLAARKAQPSTVIYEILSNSSYGLQEVFYGMRNIGLVEQNGLIARNDAIVNIEAKTNINILDYLTYLVSCMTPVNDNRSSVQKSGLYVLNVIDDVTDVFQGPYFTVKQTDRAEKYSDKGLGVYNIDIGYPTQNVVTEFNIENNETYSIYYDYSNKLTQEQYTWRINNSGEMEPVYTPLLPAGNSRYKTNEADRSWWTAVTSYPISASIRLKGLLRPALLMSHLKLNMYYYGKKHISSGTYLITQQVDTVNEGGFSTTLSLVKESGDTDDRETVNSTAKTSSTNNKTTNNKNSFKPPTTGVN